LASFFVLKSRSCAEKDSDELEVIQMIGVIIGTIMFILSFFNIAAILYDFKIIFYSVSFKDFLYKRRNVKHLSELFCRLPRILTLNLKAFMQ
jgi:hypothetical protein